MDWTEIDCSVWGFGFWLDSKPQTNYKKVYLVVVRVKFYPTDSTQNVLARIGGSLEESQTLLVLTYNRRDIPRSSLDQRTFDYLDHHIWIIWWTGGGRP